jgi:hypothetical protein
MWIILMSLYDKHSNYFYNKNTITIKNAVQKEDSHYN